MPPSALPNQFSRGIVDKTLYVRRSLRTWTISANSSISIRGLVLAIYLILYGGEAWHLY